MRQKLLLPILFVFSLSVVCYSQKTETENVKVDKTNHQVTITEGEVYAGSKSEKALDYYNKASGYADKQDLENAKKLYLKAIKEDSKFIEAYDNLGIIYRKLGDFDNAIKCYKKSIELYPSGEMAHQNLASAYSFKKEYNKAIDEYKELLKLSAENPEGYFGIANTYMTISQFDKALINAKKALVLYKKTNSHHIADGYYLIGLIHYYKNEKEDAYKYFQSAKENGAKLHPQIEKEFFSKKSDDFKLETKEDYVKYEKDFIAGYDWLLKTPLGTDTQKRKEISAFLLKWMTGCPYTSVVLSDKIVKYADCGDCLMIFLGGWVSNAIKTKEYKDKFKGNLAGTENVIQFYLANKRVLGKKKSIEKLIKYKEKNKLENFIKKNM